MRGAHAQGDLRADSDTGALMSLLLLIFPPGAGSAHAWFLDPITGLDEPTPGGPLAVRRLVAVLAAFDAQHPRPTQPDPIGGDHMTRTRSGSLAAGRTQLGEPATEAVRRGQRKVLGSADIDHARPGGLGEVVGRRTRHYAMIVRSSLPAGGGDQGIQPFVIRDAGRGRLADNII